MAAFSGYIPALLRALNAPDTPQNRLFLQLWQRAEGGSAANNPFNTTQPEHGASNYNGVGVKNYGSPQQGLEATVRTLENGRYGSIVRDLRSGHATAKKLGVDLAQSPWGTGSGVLRLLGAGDVTPPAGSSGSSVGLGTGLDQDSMKQLLSSYLFQQAQAALSGHQSGGSSGLLQLALARKALGASAQLPDTYGSSTHPDTGVRTTQTRSRVPIVGTFGNEDPLFLHKLGAAAAAAGVTQIRAISGERSPAHNAAVGGVAHSNHLPDANGNAHALDAEGYIPGRGWVPLGAALRGIAPKFGLRSGDVPGFFNGAPDPNHVDDGFNVRGS